MKPKAHKLELTIPISEEDLLEMLLDRYGAARLQELGIYSQTSVIRSFEIDENRKCQFKVCAVSLVDVEGTTYQKPEEPAVVPSTTPSTSCATTDGGGCPGSKPIRFDRRPKSPTSGVS